MKSVSTICENRTPASCYSHGPEDGPKVALPYARKTSFVSIEDACNDWCDIKELEAEKSGLKGFEGEAAVCKRLLNRDLLRDPINGVSYVRRFARPHFTK